MNNSKQINGRSSNYISIYDYPEHLNPFSEDDQHKRIRFWKIGSKNSQKIGRSNSFSLNGIKEMWAFKTFKLKKRSSTLGINKTSESPPMLRRQVHPVYDTSTYSTVDTRSRHTIDIGLSDNFQRNAVFRSSLQDVTRDKSDIGMFRNDRYRSTIQNGYNTVGTPQTNRYMYGGSVTPQPSRLLAASYVHGSSQSSLNSTNPFDEDDTISQAESIDSTSPVRRSRKKRRAPPPPVVAASTPLKVEIHPEIIKENSLEEVEANEILQISNLTSEIESFVKTADTDAEQIEIHPNNPAPKLTTEKMTNKADNSPQSSKGVKDSQLSSNEAKDCTHSSVIIQDSTQSSIEIQTSEIREIAPMAESRQSPENNEDYPDRMSQSPDKDSPSKMTKFNSEKQLNIFESPPKIIVRLASNESDENPVECSSTAFDCKNDATNDTVEYRIDQNTNESKLVTDELKIIESTDPTPVPMARNSNERYSIRFVALKNYSPEVVRRNEIDELKSVKPITMNCEMDELKSVKTTINPPSKPADKRRSVKDIIASINKSQSLLRINRDKYKRNNHTEVINTLPMERKTPDNRMDERINEKQLNEMISRMEDVDINNSNIPVTVEHFNELNNNNGELFKKCPIRSGENGNAKASNLDWNPVPKPRRAKHMIANHNNNNDSSNSNNNTNDTVNRGKN